MISFLQKTIEIINTEIKQGAKVVVKLQPSEEIVSPSAPSAVTTATFSSNCYIMPGDIYCPEERKEKG